MATSFLRSTYKKLKLKIRLRIVFLNAPLRKQLANLKP